MTAQEFTASRPAPKAAPAPKKSRTGKGWDTPERRAQWAKELADTVAEIAAAGPAAYAAHISRGNVKIGEAWSVSLLPFLTCPAFVRGTCGPWCYAAKMATLHPSVRRAWMVNTALALTFPSRYWETVRREYAAAAAYGVEWRWHVGGEAPSAEYVGQILDTAESFPAVKAWMYSKREEEVNAVLDSRPLPPSLSVILSATRDHIPHNPHGLALSYVITPGESVPDVVDRLNPSGRVTVCPGRCEGCKACRDARPGDLILFYKH